MLVLVIMLLKRELSGRASDPVQRLHHGMRAFGRQKVICPCNLRRGKKDRRPPMAAWPTIQGGPEGFGPLRPGRQVLR